MTVLAAIKGSLPEPIKQHLDNVVVDVEDEPDDETLSALGFTEQDRAEGDTLYGLFVPMNVPTSWSGEAADVLEWPHRIIIYKRPLEEDFASRRQLMIEIRKTVIHELAHHFGYTDRDLEKFDDNPNPFPDERI